MTWFRRSPYSDVAEMIVRLWECERERFAGPYADYNMIVYHIHPVGARIGFQVNGGCFVETENGDRIQLGILAKRRVRLVETIKDKAVAANTAYQLALSIIKDRES